MSELTCATCGTDLKAAKHFHMCDEAMAEYCCQCWEGVEEECYDKHGEGCQTMVWQ